MVEKYEVYGLGQESPLNDNKIGHLEKKAQEETLEIIDQDNRRLVF